MYSPSSSHVAQIPRLSTKAAAHPSQLVKPDCGGVMQSAAGVGVGVVDGEGEGEGDGVASGHHCPGGSMAATVSALTKSPSSSHCVQTPYSGTYKYAQPSQELKPVCGAASHRELGVGVGAGAGASEGHHTGRRKQMLPRCDAGLLGNRLLVFGV